MLKARLFEPYEISDCQDDDSQIPLRIPRFVVEDESYVDVFETQNLVANTLAKASFSQSELEGSM